MVSYVNVHAILDARRRFAKASTSTDSEPPQVRYSFSFNDLVLLYHLIFIESALCRDLGLLW